MTCKQCKYFLDFYKIDIKVCTKHGVRLESDEYKTRSCTEFSGKDEEAGEQE